MSEIGATAIAGLLGFSAALLALSLADLLRPGHWQSRDTWRDPAPALFRWLLPIARTLAGYRAVTPHRAAALQKALDRAGVGYAILPAELQALQALLALAAVVPGLGAAHGLNMAGSQAGALVLSAILLGVVYPKLWLHEQARRRQQIVAREFPALLELLTLSIRAGLGFSAALNQAIRFLPPGPLRQECQRLGREIRTGSSRHQALEGLANRTDLAAVKSFVAALIQADETGAAISDVLGEQARQRRRERFAAAEKRANEAPVRMLLPLVTLLFPVTFLIIGFPIALQFLNLGGLP
ncbi:hypothetical protein GJ672_04005 [Spiribacter sp. 2438]|uniref:type II secretion system F family protein n=1 Tax=Spiribacter sp. 2438 TaxID=2666185 RepID=UPI0012AF4545|nr:type II secretion system F family protein [Spiribacter sp. 2438]QGM21514.1 hypothetical protein GJ672_04005 [Spiribacter sp. 2438]